ncbi:axoneme-associated protein mst101(2)-like [Sander lucioperca]|uniref:axoneme-associated protein mst101(2)-like n=1 Tax=Sander lucioperca TaxID=283035 RepID=UPI00125D8D5F|nr:axoneme-associated protein mst101(2)-like [Sander lucioperca]
MEMEVLLIESQRKVSQMEEQIHQRDTEILDLSRKNETLSQTLAEKIDQLKSKEAELQQSKKRFTQDLTEKEKSWETRFFFLQMKCNCLEENLKKKQAENKDWQKKVKQMDEEKVELEEKFTKDLNEKENSWETRYFFLQMKCNCLEENLKKKQAENKDWQKKVKQMDEEKVELEEKFTMDLNEKEKSWETRYFFLQMKCNCLEENLKKKQAENKDWQKKVKQMDEEKVELEEKFTKDLNEKEKSWETRYFFLQMKCNCLEENLKKKQAENKDWEKKVKQMDEEKVELEEKFTKDLDEKEKSWETRFNALQTMHNSLQENLKTELAENKDWQKKVKQMDEEKEEREGKFAKDLAEKQRSWEIKDKQMKEEKKEVEDLCLKMNEKRRGFLFRKKAGDRQAELEKMKSKMSQKEMKKTGKIEKAEKKKKEAKMDKEKEKVEKGFLSWMNRKKCNKAE